MNKTFVNNALALFNRIFPVAALTLLVIAVSVASSVAQSDLNKTNKVCAAIPAPADKTAAEQTAVFYEKRLSDSKIVTFAYYPEAGRVGVVIEENGNLAGYIADNVEKPFGVFELTLVREFGKGAAPEKLAFNLAFNAEQSVVFSLSGDNVIAFDAVLDRTETTTNMVGGICQRRGGVCSDVRTDRDWRSCFWCCFIAGCS